MITLCFRKMIYSTAFNSTVYGLGLDEYGSISITMPHIHRFTSSNAITTSVYITSDTRINNSQAYTS